MKPLLSLIIVALSLSACAVDNEQGKLCKFMHTCDSDDSGEVLQRFTETPHD